MKNSRLKLLLATTALAFVSSIFSAVDANAQVATVSRTDLDVSTGLVVSSGMANAVSQTYFDNDGRTALIIKNASGGSLTVTINSAFASYFVERLGLVSLSNQTNVVANGATIMYGPFGTERWNTANNTVLASLSTVTGVSVSAVRLPKQ